MGLIASGLSHIGQKRKSNQDSIYFNVAHKLFVVADGMGGHNGGDIASSLAVKHIPDYLVEALPKNERPDELIKNAIRHANLVIHSKAAQDAVLKGMGTTVVSLYFANGELTVANVGDSRAYMINEKRIYQLSRDHSLIQEKMNMGIYTREQAARDPMKNVLIRSVGFDPDVDVDLYNYKVAKGDLFIICSDGLHGIVTEHDVLGMVNHFIPAPLKATQADLDKLVSNLIALANHNGGTDNVSVIAVLAQ